MNIPIWLLAIAPIVASCGMGSQLALQSSEELRDRCEANPAFAYVPAGEFVYGSDRRERDYAYRISAEAVADSTDAEAVNASEQRLREVGWFDREPDRQVRSLDGFCMARNLVTNADYLEFVQATGHRLPGISAADYQAQGFLVHPYRKVQEFLWQNGTFPVGKGQHPVVLVSYADAIAYAEWQGKQDGVSYRLPTAMEWEKAARGPESFLFPWGNQWRDDGTNAESSGLYYTSAIATFPLSRSAYGLEDMAGNVFEYTSSLVTRGDQQRSVMKGCSWDDFPGFCRAAYRHTRPVESRHILFGFRLVQK